MKAFNELTPAQAELLDLLAEECAEVIQAICKIKRHGYESCHPDRPETRNRIDLMKEIGDVSAAVELLSRSGDIKGGTVLFFKDAKLSRIYQYLHHNQENGK